MNLKLEGQAEIIIELSVFLKKEMKLSYWSRESFYLSSRLKIVSITWMQILHLRISYYGSTWKNNPFITTSHPFLSRCTKFLFYFTFNLSRFVDSFPSIENMFKPPCILQKCYSLTMFPLLLLSQSTAFGKCKESCRLIPMAALWSLSSLISPHIWLFTISDIADFAESMRFPEDIFLLKLLILTTQLDALKTHSFSHS